MKTILRFWYLHIVILFLAVGMASTARAQGTAFTYQSRLLQNGTPANGLYDFRFRAASDPFASNYVGSAIFTNGITVGNGLFTVVLDFDGIFNGANIFLEVSVRTNGGNSYTTLAPLQPLTPSPYAISAENLIGAIPSGQVAGLYSNTVSFNNPANTFSGAFAGNGSAVTNVNAVTVGGVAAANLWQLTGNNVTGGQFIGTTNNQALEMHVNSLRAMRLEPGVIDINHSNVVNVIGGSVLNYVASGVSGATIGGGGALRLGGSTNLTNRVIGDFGTVSGGYDNASGLLGAVGGGSGNSTVQAGDTVGGGRDNSSSGTYSTVGGGQGNGASGRWSTVPGGFSSFATGSASFAAGKYAEALNDGTFVWADGTVLPFSSTGANQFLIQASGGVGIGTTFPQAPLHVSPGGFDFTTPNANSIACFEKSGNGYLSILCGTTSENGIVFGNSNTNTDAGIIYNSSGVRSGLEFRTGTNITQMTILANGNVGVGTTAPSREFEVQNTSDTEIGIKSQDAGGHLWTLQSSSVSGSANLDASFQIIDRTLNIDRFYIGTNGNVGIATNSANEKLTVHGNILASGSICANNGVSCASDRNLKENFKPVDEREVLDKVTKLPVTQWNYKSDIQSPHVGPVAQEFHAAFGLGHDDVTISTIDEGGIALAAIKGLNEKLEQEVKEKDAKIGELEKRLVALEAALQHK